MWRPPYIRSICMKQLPLSLKYTANTCLFQAGGPADFPSRCYGRFRKGAGPPFVNAEECQYLVIEDAFPAGRPLLSK